MRYLILAPILFAAACDTGPGDPSTQQTGKDEVSIRYGQTVTVPGTVLQIGFQEVVSDSRCPSDVVCVWEGEGRVELGLTFGDGPTVPVEIVERETIRHGGYAIMLVQLSPYPISTRPQVPANYVVSLRVTRATELD